VDRSFVDLNRASTQRMRALAARLSDDELQHPVGQHWTVAIVLAHLAFLDRRALWVLDATERAGTVVNSDYDIFINDLSLPLWAAVPPRAAARIAIETADPKGFKNPWGLAPCQTWSSAIKNVCMSR
jgi:Mycothiol maleylpyruvate isomerase N-terminal domain